MEKEQKCVKESGEDLFEPSHQLNMTRGMLEALQEVEKRKEAEEVEKEEVRRRWERC